MTNSLASKTDRALNGEGSVYFLASTKRWMVAYTDIDGRRKARVAPKNKQTRSGATAYLRALLKARDAGESSERSPTLAEFLPTWLEVKRITGCRSRTLEAYEERIRVHVLPTLGAMRLDKIQAAHITGLYGRLLDSGRSPTTVVLIHDSLRNLLRTARRRRLVPHVATEFVEPPTRAEYEARTLSIDECRTLLAACTLHRRYGALWTFMLGTGCRFGEAAGLTWGAVDLVASTAHINQQVTRKRVQRPSSASSPHSAQRSVITHEISPVKTRAGQRTLHLPPWVVAALSNQQDYLAATGLLTLSDLVFPSTLGKPLQENHVLVAWHAMLKNVGLEGGPNQAPLRMHDLRHTRGTLMADAGEDLVVIQRTLGHARSSITADLYVGRVPNALRASADRFGSMIVPDED